MKLFNFSKKNDKQTIKDGDNAHVKKGNLIGIEMPKVKDSALKSKVLKLNGEGMEYYKECYYEGAQRKFEEAINIDPEYAEPYHHLAAIYLNQGYVGKWLQATKKFIELADPSNPAVKTLKPKIDALSQEELDKLSGVDYSGNPATLCIEAAGYCKRQEYEKALAKYEEAMKLKPEYGEGWSDMGLCLIEMGRYEEALEVLCKAAELIPHDMPNWSFLYLVFYLVKEHEEAERCFNHCKEMGASTEYLTNLKANAARLESKRKV